MTLYDFDNYWGFVLILYFCILVLPRFCIGYWREAVKGESDTDFSNDAWPYLIGFLLLTLAANIHMHMDIGIALIGIYHALIHMYRRKGSTWQISSFLSSRGQRAAAFSSLAWILYVIARTSGSYEFLGFYLPHWSEDSIFINLSLPPTALIVGWYAVGWISRGK